MESNKLHIKATLANPEDWFTFISEKIPGQIKENRLYLDPSIGSGYASNEVFQDGLSVMIADVWLDIDFKYEKFLKPDGNYYLALIALSPGPFISYGKGKEFVFDTDKNYKAIIIFPPTPFTLHVKKHDSLMLISIMVSREWIVNNVVDKKNESYILKALQTKIPLVLEEKFDSEHREIIKSFFYFNYKEKIKRLSAIIKILSFLIKNVSERDISKNEIPGDSLELNAIQNACFEIKRNWKSFPSISHLAKGARMGESSFKNKFKRITGKSPYQYFLQVKLDKAKEMLLNTDMTITEVGYECGYSNLSHFSRQFKKQFGVLPKDLSDTD